MDSTPLTKVAGVGPGTAAVLTRHGITTVEALAAVSLARLAAVPGFGPIRARRVRDAAAALVCQGPKAPPAPTGSAPLEGTTAPPRKARKAGKSTAEGLGREAKPGAGGKSKKDKAKGKDKAKKKGTKARKHEPKVRKAKKDRKSTGKTGRPSHPSTPERPTRSMEGSAKTFTADAPASVWQALQERFRCVREPGQRVRRTYLDTFDWRLHRRGATVWEEGKERWLRCASGKRLLGCRLAAGPPPAFAWDLPDGPLRRWVAPVIEMRRLSPVVTVDVRSQALRIVDRQEKTVVRVVLERRSAIGPRGRAIRRKMASALRIVPVKGYGGAVAKVVAFAAGELGLQPADGTELDVALAAIGRQPRDYRSKIDLPLVSGGRTDHAVKEILGALLATLRRNEDGVRRDLDSEYLHDLRVASRRARALLTQVKEVLPEEGATLLCKELAWLGKVTGPTRDLDVYLLTMPAYRESLPATAATDLEPLAEFLYDRRRQERAELVAALDGRRYRDLLRRWKRLDDAPLPEASPMANAQRPVATVASEHIWRAYRRVWRRGRRIEPDTPAALLHRLRIECKKLRYLLELFRNLYDPEEVGGLIKALKQLQDNLGAFNDLEVQQHHLREMAAQMATAGAAQPPTLMAMGRLVDQLELRQAEERRRFADCFARFSTRENRRRFRRLFREQGRAVA